MGTLSASLPAKLASLWQDSAMFPWDVLVTGAVGIAGIGGTLWQGKRAREAQTADLKASLDATTEHLKLGINTENARIRQADKRRIYATYLATVRDLITAAVRERGAIVTQSEERQADAKFRASKASDSYHQVHEELSLIASRDVMQCANTVSDFLADYLKDTVEGASARGAMNGVAEMAIDLRLAMRADLGEKE
jgi:hypothetical protein